MKIALILVIILACIAGWNLGVRHPILFVPAVLALILAMGYTLGPLPLAYHGLGDVFVVACFGLQATVLTVYALYLEVGKSFACEMPWTPAIIAGLGVGLLANNILIANNARDQETDAASAKKTIVVRWGRTFAKAHYTFNLGLGIICLTYVFGLAPLLVIPLALWQIIGFWRAQSAQEFIPFLSRAALLMLLVALLCVTATCLG
jgi:1,4-dihydroxy-2-naphthoate octaprenyltransferase